MKNKEYNHAYGLYCCKLSGFSEANRGCCGTGKIEVAILCNPLSPSVCRDSSDYVFWDSYHPTERAYRVIISQLIPKYIHRFL